MNKHVPILAYVIIGVVFGFAGYGFYSFFFADSVRPMVKGTPDTSRNLMYTAPKNYDECTNDPGSYSLESYPTICVAPDGSRFVQPVSPSETSPTNLPD